MYIVNILIHLYVKLKFEIHLQSFAEKSPSDGSELSNKVCFFNQKKVHLFFTEKTIFK